jgi:hypothetical protein
MSGKSARNSGQGPGAKKVVQAPSDYDPEEPYTLTLEKPVSIGKTSWAKLQLEVLEGGSIWDIPVDGQTIGDTLTIGARMAGVPKEVVQRLRGGDLMRLFGIVNAAMANFQGTGS